MNDDIDPKNLTIIGFIIFYVVGWLSLAFLTMVHPVFNIIMFYWMLPLAAAIVLLIVIVFLLGFIAFICGLATLINDWFKRRKNV